MHSSGLDISSPRRFKKDIIDKTCPNSSDIEVARDFLFSTGDQNSFLIYGFSTVYWMQVSLVSMQKNLTLKARQRNRYTFPVLLRQYQLVANVLRHDYSLSSHHRPAISNDDYFSGMYRPLDSQLLTVGKM
jgi:hypothetical protein